LRRLDVDPAHLRYVLDFRAKVEHGAAPRHVRLEIKTFEKVVMAPFDIRRIFWRRNFRGGSRWLRCQRPYRIATRQQFRHQMPADPA